MASADILRVLHTEHSDLPWSCDRYAVYSGKESIASCNAWDLSDEGDSANAAFIVRACNAHYQMLEALKAVVRVADRNTAEFDLARAAIAAAEAEAGR